MKFIWNLLLIWCLFTHNSKLVQCKPTWYKLINESGENNYGISSKWNLWCIYFCYFVEFSLLILGILHKNIFCWESFMLLMFYLELFICVYFIKNRVLIWNIKNAIIFCIYLLMIDVYIVVCFMSTAKLLNKRQTLFSLNMYCNKLFFY